MPKRAFITGCSRGIGLATALALRERGWTVTATLRGGQGEAELRAAGVHISKVDVTDEAALRAAVDAAIARDGGLDAVVANAGAGLFGCFEDLELAELRGLFELNVFGAMTLVHAALPALRAARGRVVVVSSVAGRMAAPGSTAYSATKFAVEGWAEGLRHELAPMGVTVALVEPGPTDTGFFTARGRGSRVGTGPYAAITRRLETLHAELGASKEPVQSAVDGVLAALSRPHPPLRIVTGRSASMQLMALRLLPWRVYEAIAKRKLALPRAPGVDGGAR